MAGSPCIWVFQAFSHSTENSSPSSTVVKYGSGTSPSLDFLSDGPLLECLVYFRQTVLETSWCQIASCTEKSVGWMNLFLGVQKDACHLFLFAQKRPLM